MTAVVAAICGLAGLAVGGYGVDLVFLRRPDFSLATLLAMAVMGGIGWCVGSVVAWRAARRRPPTSRVDVALFVAGAAFVLWLGVSAVREIRAANFGPMIDDVGPHHPSLPLIATAFMVDATIAAFTLLALGLTRER